MNASIAVLPLAALYASVAAAVVASLHTMLRVAESQWGYAAVTGCVAVAACVWIASPGQWGAAGRVREATATWSSMQRQTHAMGMLAGAAGAATAYSTAWHAWALLRRGHWAAAVLVAGAVAGGMHALAAHLRIVPSAAVTWRRVGRRQPWPEGGSGRK